MWVKVSDCRIPTPCSVSAQYVQCVKVHGTEATQDCKFPLMVESLGLVEHLTMESR
jgi:hypothetical protein